MISDAGLSDIVKRAKFYQEININPEEFTEMALEIIQARKIIKDFKVFYNDDKEQFLKFITLNSWLPSKKQSYEAASKYVKADHCKAAFYKGVLWLKEQLTK